MLGTLFPSLLLLFCLKEFPSKLEIIPIFDIKELEEYDEKSLGERSFTTV